MQVVQINVITLHGREIDCGVPQGSISGPLFFILYIDDLPKSTRDAECLLFADDNDIYIYIFNENCNYKTLMDNLNDEICHVVTWLWWLTTVFG